MTIRDRFDDLGYMFGRMPWRWDALVPFWILVTLGIGVLALRFTSPIWALAALACGALLGFLGDNDAARCRTPFKQCVILCPERRGIASTYAANVGGSLEAVRYALRLDRLPKRIQAQVLVQK